jgi:hypothetical protein
MCPISPQLYALICHIHSEELGWVIAELLEVLKIGGDEGMNEEMVKYQDAFSFSEWLHILGAIEELKE